MNLTDIQSLVDKADHSYYTLGKEIMDDSKYDKLKSELKALNPSDSRLTTVGSSIRNSILQTTKHTIPMGSQDKAMNKEEFIVWVNKNGLENTILHGSYKMDGGSLSLEYRDGRLVTAVSRGDGLAGENITANAMKFKNLPHTAICPNGKTFSGFIRGETILTNDDWLEVDSAQTSNPRNLAVGIARRKDGTESEYLKFYAFRMFDMDGELMSDMEIDMSNYLIKMGFNIAPFVIGKYTDIWEYFIQTQQDRKTLSFWIDGIVVKVNDLETQTNMGESSNCPLGQIAIKFPAEGAVTTLRNIEWQVGSSGAIAPVANFDTVRIGGTNVSNATLCNMDYIETLDICIGDEISVVKAGDIIPRVMEVTKKSSNRVTTVKPSKCPCCSGAVGHKSNVGGTDSTTLYCLNEKCFAVVCGRIERYVKSLDIQGLGGNVIEALVKELGVETAADIYALHSTPQDFAGITLSGGVNLGQKRADKILEEIDKKRDLTISEFIGSLGIFGLGKRRVALIQAAIPNTMDTLNDWFSGNLVKYANQAGVPNIAQRIHDELIAQKDDIQEFLVNGVTIKAAVKKFVAPNAKVFCITGKMSRPKEYFYSMLEAKGQVTTDTFSKTINYLIAADPNSGSSKMEKAKKYGIKVIDELELMDILQKI
jgi:DNA ligase (NAD+)